MGWVDRTFSVGQIFTAAQAQGLHDNPIAVANGDSGAPRVSPSAIGTWPLMGGTESWGDVTITADTAMHPGVYECSNLTVDSAATITVSSAGPLIFICSSQALIYGDIDVSCMGAAGGTFTGSWSHYGAHGTIGGAGGTGGSILNRSGGGGAGLSPFCPSIRDVDGSQNGQDGRAVPAEAYGLAMRQLFSGAIPTAWFDVNTISPDLPAHGGGGGGAAASGDGAPGGGVVAVICDQLTIEGTISANGANSTGGTSAPGGGGGGAVIFCARTLVGNTGTLTASGGAGANSTYDGGAGGAGVTGVWTLP